MVEKSSLTPQEVADILKIAKTTVYELIKRGELNAYRIGRKFRVELSDVEAYKKSQKNISSINVEVPSPIKTSETILTPAPSSEISDNKELLICGQDILLDILSLYLEKRLKGIKISRSYIGSYRSLVNLYEGEAQIATCHLWDGDSGQYNVPYVRRLLPGTPAVIIHIACRMQGFYVAKGNPKGIKGWDDLKRPDITIINRERGSGTRVLLDEHLRLMGITGSSIKGYNRECMTHLAVASTVSRGGADLALGNEKAGLQVQGIDFIPLQKERYELVMKREDMGKPPFKALMEILGSEEFKTELYGIGGYDLTETGRIVAET